MAAAAAAAARARRRYDFTEDVQARLAAREESTPFRRGGQFVSSVVVDDEAAAANGEMFKDARLPGRPTDQIHAAEFDMERRVMPKSVHFSPQTSMPITFPSNASPTTTMAGAPLVEAVQPAVACDRSPRF